MQLFLIDDESWGTNGCSERRLKMKERYAMAFNCDIFGDGLGVSSSYAR